MEQILDSFKNVPSYIKILESVSSKESITLLSTADSFLGCLAASIAYHTGKNVLVITNSLLRAQKMSEDISQWLTDKPCVWIPPREVNFNKSIGSRETTWKRLESLQAILSGASSVACLPVNALMDRMLPSESFLEAFFSIQTTDKMRPGQLVEKLVHMGYERVDMVEGKGQCAIRGDIVDVFVPSEQYPFRLQFYDDEVESLRSFNCVSQRTVETLDMVSFIPATEIILPASSTAQASSRLAVVLGKRQKTESHQNVPFNFSPIIDDMDDELPNFFDLQVQEDGFEPFIPPSNIFKYDEVEAILSGAVFEGIEGYIHIISDRTVSLLEWFPNAILMLENPVKLRETADNASHEFAHDITHAIERGDAVPEQKDILLSYDTLQQIIANRLYIAISEYSGSFKDLSRQTGIEMDVRGTPSYHSRLNELSKDIKARMTDHYHVILTSGGIAKGKRLSQSLQELSINARFEESHIILPARGEAIIFPRSFHKGFVWPEANIALYADSDIFGSGYRRIRTRSYAGERISAFTELNIGDLVVHVNYGIGVYMGMAHIQSEGTFRDYLLIQYQGSDKLYIPTEQLDMVQRFIGNQENPPRLSKLGGGEWQRQKNRVRAGLKEIAFDLVKLYAERISKKGYAFSQNTPWQRQFEDLFPYELTSDQQQSLQDIERDMESPINMDRLLCGDVGYGKTEVALRASFKALMDSKQVAFLAPTTVLTQQHFITIQKRFESFPITCAMLSRFLSSSEQREVIQKVKDGKVDILVGTHRMLGHDVIFKDLGLLIIDEEQRFGVSHKEIIKHIKTNVDVLSLSATPIPRTLHMSMVGIRDMSLLETPPEERRPVQTYIMEYSEAAIRDIILREISRNGQVFFLYNRVNSIASFYDRLRILVPEARIGVAHGQMREQLLEDVMADFYHGAFNVLLCTTIIENGIDIPLANTIIVYDADRFGLSQLYQLRGRVGRSNRQAYAYFTVRLNKIITESAQKRLAAIRDFTEFGAGFRVAMRDLEIRGAGNLLGPEQHGHLSAVGYDLYSRLIEEALRSARGEEGIPTELETRIDLKIDAYLPNDYVHNERQRMEIYRRISVIKNYSDHEDMEKELEDRFGVPPDSVIALLNIALLRAMALQLGIIRVTWREGTMIMTFNEIYAPDPMKLLKAIINTDKRLSLSAASPAALLFKDTKRPVEAFLVETIIMLEKLVSLVNDYSIEDKKLTFDSTIVKTSFG